MKVILYSKPDCPLCEEVKAELVTLRQELSFVLEERNIEERSHDFERFRFLIPVVDIEGGELLTPPHTKERLAWALRRRAADS